MKTIPATVPDEASTGEMISGPTLSGQPGKAVGHAVGKLTLRHDLAHDDATGLRDRLAVAGRFIAAEPVDGGMPLRCRAARHRLDL